MKYATKGCRKIALFARLVLVMYGEINGTVNSVVDETMRNELINSSNRKTNKIDWREFM